MLEIKLTVPKAEHVYVKIAPPHESTSLLSNEKKSSAPRALPVASICCAVIGLALLATNEPFLGASSDGPTPFKTVTRDKLVPGSLWASSDSGLPFPTGAWWSNLAMGNGDQIIAALPYQYKIDKFSRKDPTTLLWGGGLQVLELLGRSPTNIADAAQQLILGLGR